MSTATTTDFSEYTVYVGNDESNYGSECTREQAVKIADSIQSMIENQYPGINVIRTEEIGASTPTSGPDQNVIDDIHAWIQENWTSGL